MTSPESDQEFLTIGELAEYLKVPEETVRSWRHRDTGPRGVRLGKHVRYRRSDVDAWIAERSLAQHPNEQSNDVI